MPPLYQTCPCCVQLHLWGCIIMTLATWSRFYPREKHQGWPIPGCGWPILHGFDRPLLCRAGPPCLVGLHREWSMAVGPAWEALIHATSCHLPHVPTCSPSAAVRLLSSVMSIFRPGWFLPSKMRRMCCETGRWGLFWLFVVCVFLKHSTVHCQLMHIL